MAHNEPRSDTRSADATTWVRSTQTIAVCGVLIGDEVVIATDGYLRPAAALAAAERELAQVLSEDPLLIRLHHGFRPVARTAVSFDDRAYLRFRA